MNNGFFESMPYLKQMQDQFQKMFGDDFVGNLMNSMQVPGWNGGDAAGTDGAHPSHNRFDAQDQQQRGPAGGLAGGASPWWGGQTSGWNPFTSAGAASAPPFPAVDVWETRHEIILDLDISGMEHPSDIKVSVFPDYVVVKGERNLPAHTVEQQTRAVAERVTGPFERKIPLPGRVRKQHAKAVYRAGVLELRLVKEGKGDGDGTVIDIDFA